MARIAGLMMLVAVVEMAVGCDAVPWAQQGAAVDEAVKHGLVIRLTAPEQVAQGESFEIGATVVNRRSETVTLSTPHSCLFEFGIFSEGKRVPFEGTWMGCLTVVTEHPIPPGEAVERTFEVRAARSDEEPVSSGTYTAHVVPQVRTVNGEPAELPAVTRDLVQ